MTKHILNNYQHPKNIIKALINKLLKLQTTKIIDLSYSYDYSINEVKIMISISYIWLIIALGCFVLELMTPTFSFLSITFGAIFGWLTSLVIDNVVIQLIVFLIAFAIFFIKLRPLIYKKDKEKFNTESWIGTSVISDSVITSTSGTTKKDGSIWQIRSEEGFTFEKGETLIIKKIDGNKLIVTKDVE